MKKVLVTGGAGFIGSHMVRALIANKFEPVVFDNFSTGHRQVIPKGVRCVKGDIRNAASLNKVFSSENFYAVIHFAGLIAVGESVHEPEKYYDNNVTGSLRLLEAIGRAKVPNLIFSSTAAVYGPVKKARISEGSLLEPGNPYGATKLMIERAIADHAQKYGLRYAILRYFNAGGAHPEGGTGEWHEQETHLVPNILFSLLDKDRTFKIFGQDYGTKDGTCVRDYIHVMDLCEGHLAALRGLGSRKPSGAYNLGTGKGLTVLEVIRAVERVTGQKVPLRFGKRRPGDAERLVADPSLAQKTFGWKARYTLDDIIASAWAWETHRRERYC